jgi:hypothetical protein
MATPHGNTADEPQKGGMLNAILGLIGFFFMAIALGGLLNTAFGWNIGLKGGVELPKTWSDAFSLLTIAGVWVGIWLIVNKVPAVRNFSRRRPWIIAVIIIAFVLVLFFIIDSRVRANAAEARKEWEQQMKHRQDSITADSLKAIQSLQGDSLH